MRHQMQDDFGIAGGLKDGAASFQILAQFGGVGDVAVVRDRDRPLLQCTENGWALRSTVSPAVE